MPPLGNNLPPVEESVSPVIGLPAGNSSTVIASSVAKELSPAPVDSMPVQQNRLASQLTTVVPVQQFVGDESIQFELPEEQLAPELKLQLKNTGQGSETNVQARVSSLSQAALASSLQQVPVSTGLASVNMHTTVLSSDSSLTILPSLSSAISTPVQSPAWSQSISERISWMINGNFQNAEIKLNPAHLGPLEIKLSVNDDQASVTFISAHAPVRDALDLAMPRLREMLEQQGLNLTDVDVSQYSEAESEQADNGGDQQLAGEGDATLPDGNDDQPALGRTHIDVNTGVSIYA